MSYIVKSGVKCFEAIDPKRLLIIEKEKLNNLKLIIPKLEKLKQTVGKRPKVEIFEGKEGIKSILEEILKLPEKSVYYSYANYDLFEYLSFYFPNFIKRKIKKKIRARVIQEKKSKLEKNRKEGEKLLVNMKFLSQRFDSNVFIFGNKTAFITFSKQTILGILVENESIARTQKQVFDNLWKLAK